MSHRTFQQTEAKKELSQLLGRTCPCHVSIDAKTTADNSKHAVTDTYKTCPICLEELVKNGAEVGALTFKGERIEEELYHVGCVTMMLVHRGAIKFNKTSNVNGAASPEISWGSSPVSRQLVDGFLQMPALADRQKWVNFVDWRHKGEVSVEELASLVSATLPVDEASIASFMESSLGICDGASITTAQLEDDIIPYLDRTIQEFGHTQITKLCSQKNSEDSDAALASRRSAEDSDAGGFCEEDVSCADMRVFKVRPKNVGDSDAALASRRTAEDPDAGGFCDEDVSFADMKVFKVKPRCLCD